MKIKNIIGSFLSAVFALAMFSCIDDQGNYSYKDTNVVKFEGLVGLDEKKPFEIFIGIPFTIKPEMTQTVPTAESDYTYYWLRLGTSSSNVHFDTVHVGKYMEDFDIHLAPRPAAYKMVYQAHNNVTGVTYTSDYFYFKVIDDIATGYFFLHEVDGAPVLKFQNYKSGLFEERTVDLAPLGEDLGKPINIVTYPDSNSPTIDASNGYSVSLLTESGLYRLKHDDFSYSENHNIDYFIFGDRPADFRIKQIYASRYKGANLAMLEDQDGNYMFYSAGSNLPWTYGIFSNAYLDNGVKKYFKAGAFLQADGGTAVFFDEDSRSIAVKAPGSNYCTNFTVANEKTFKFNNVDYTPICFLYQFYGPKMPGEGYRYNMIVKMNSGGYKLRTWTSRDNSQLFDADFNATDIENAKYFSMSYCSSSTAYTDYGTLFFYATDKKVYCFNTTKSENATTELYTAPDGNIISAINVEVHAGSGTAACPFGDHLLITTNSETGANTSTFEIFKIEKLTGAIDIAKDAAGKELRWTKMPKIVGVDWKNR